MPKAITAITRLFRPIPAIIRFFTASDGYEVIPHAQPPVERRRRSLNG